MKWWPIGITKDGVAYGGTCRETIERRKHAGEGARATQTPLRRAIRRRLRDGRAGSGESVVVLRAARREAGLALPDDANCGAPPTGDQCRRDFPVLHEPSRRWHDSGLLNWPTSLTLARARIFRGMDKDVMNLVSRRDCHLKHVTVLRSRLTGSEESAELVESKLSIQCL